MSPAPPSTPSSFSPSIRNSLPEPISIPLAQPYTWSFTTAAEGGILVVVARQTGYYYHNGQRVAMHETGLDGQNDVYWLLGDHLGTTSLVLDNAGGVVAESRHYPYGGVRWTAGTLTTHYRFAGQKLEARVNLYHMGARWYDDIGRWTSPDTIVPDPSNPQLLNRFTYCLNNSLTYRDPSGHYNVQDVANAAGAGFLFLGTITLANMAAMEVNHAERTEVISEAIEEVFDVRMPMRHASGSFTGQNAAHPAQGSSFTIAEEAVPELDAAMQSIEPSLEIPDLQSSLETVALELPAVHEVGKNAPVPGQPEPRRKLLPEYKNSRPPIEVNTPPKAPPGPPRFPLPTGDAKAKAMFALYMASRFLSWGDAAGIDQLMFEQEWPFGDFLPY